MMKQLIKNMRQKEILHLIYLMKWKKLDVVVGGSIYPGAAKNIENKLKRKVKIF